jgi:hypothetical protein
VNRVWSLLALATAAVVVPGCGIFDTREPEPPSQSVSTSQPPVSPEIVLLNFKAAIEEHNVVNYMRCLADTTSNPGQTFVFVPVADFQQFFQTWSREDEERYFRNLGEPSVSPSLSFSGQHKDTPRLDSVVFTMNYTLFLPHRRSDLSQIVRGLMQLGMTSDVQGRWSIALWRDLKTDTDSTWSYLKANF